MIARILLWTLASCAAAQQATHGACVESLPPALVREVSAEALRDAHGIAWLNGGTLAVGHDRGVVALTLADGSTRTLVSGRGVPHGLPEVEDIATDGKTLVAFSKDYSDVAVDVADGRILAAYRGPAYQVIDLAVRGDTLYLLGFPAILDREKKNGALWSGRVGDKRDSMRLLHEVEPEALDHLRSCFPPFGGAVVVQGDGSVAMITAAEAGVHRFAPDGTALPTLGSALTELVPPRLNEIRRLFGADVEGRYHEVLNRQPIADDLIETSAGLAIVVRRAAGGKLWWELWFPDASGGARRRIRLELEEKRTIGGHLRCAGRGRRLACLFGRMTELFHPDRASIVLFDLDRVNRRGRCGT